MPVAGRKKSFVPDNPTDINPSGKSKGRRAPFGPHRRGRSMKKFRVRYETKILESREGVERVAASGKGQAMLAAQAKIHPNVRTDEPYFHFEPLTIRLLDTPDTYEVAYRTKVETEKSGDIEVAAEDADKAAAKARFAVHQELIPPKDFKALAVTEIEDGQ
jgi:hypothetical protein